jgi:GNAT superfamily N-acetyltransferase
MKRLVVEKLKGEHAKCVASFSCGKKDEDEFLKKDAMPSQEMRLSETYLLFEDGQKEKIISYVTITVGSFQLSRERKLNEVKISDKPFRIFSSHMPCLLIGKLATDKNETGRGGASHLIDFAIGKAMGAALPIPFVALHTYQGTIRFYEKLGFKVAFHPKGRNRQGLATMYFELKPGIGMTASAEKK